LIDFAQVNKVKLVVVGPEQPLVDGINEAFKAGSIHFLLIFYFFISK